jgi:hypothetical protein
MCSDVALLYPQMCPANGIALHYSVCINFVFIYMSCHTPKTVICRRDKDQVITTIACASYTSRSQAESHSIKFHSLTREKATSHKDSCCMALCFRESDGNRGQDTITLNEDARHLEDGGAGSICACCLSLSPSCWWHYECL